MDSHYADQGGDGDCQYDDKERSNSENDAIVRTVLVIIQYSHKYAYEVIYCVLLLLLLLFIIVKLLLLLFYCYYYF